MSQFNISPEEVSKLEEKFEIKSNERKLKNFLKLLTFIALVTMSIYHFYASGFGTIRDILHRGIHISFVVGLVFLFYLSLIHISEPTRRTPISYAVFCLKKKK